MYRATTIDRAENLSLSTMCNVLLYRVQLTEPSIRSTERCNIKYIYGEITRRGNLLRKRFHEFHFEIVHVVL